MGIKDTLPYFQSFLRSGKLAPEKNIPFLALWASRFLFSIAGKPLEGEGKGEGENQTAGRLPPFSCSAKLQNLDESHDLSYQTKSENRSSDGPELYNPRVPILREDFTN